MNIYLLWRKHIEGDSELYGIYATQELAKSWEKRYELQSNSADWWEIEERQVQN